MLYCLKLCAGSNNEAASQILAGDSSGDFLQHLVALRGSTVRHGCYNVIYALLLTSLVLFVPVTFKAVWGLSYEQGMLGMVKPQHLRHELEAVAFPIS